MPGDPFYHSLLWRSIKAQVRQRSGGTCEVRGCDMPAKVCDHLWSRKRGCPDDAAHCRDLCRAHDNQVKEDRYGNRRSGGVPVVVGCDADGRPLDASHHWNAGRRH